MSKQTEKNYVEVWEDYVDLKDLFISILLCVGLSLFGYIIAPEDGSKPLIFGLSGGVIGFITSSIIIKPKRKIKYHEEEE